MVFLCFGFVLVVWYLLFVLVLFGGFVVICCGATTHCLCLLLLFLCVVFVSPIDCFGDADLVCCGALCCLVCFRFGVDGFVLLVLWWCLPYGLLLAYVVC